MSRDFPEARLHIFSENSKMFPDAQREPPVFQFLSIVFLLSLGSSEKILSAPSLQVFLDIEVHISTLSLPSLLEAEQSQLT